MAESKVQMIARRIREEILPSARVGDRLPGIREIGTWFGGATQTVQSAFHVLVDEGLVEPRHGSGYYLARSPRSDEADIDIPDAIRQARKMVTDLDRRLDTIERAYRLSHTRENESRESNHSERGDPR